MRQIIKLIYLVGFLVSLGANAGLMNLLPTLGTQSFVELNSISLNGTDQSVTFGQGANSILEYNLPFSGSVWFKWNTGQATDPGEFVLIGNAANGASSQGTWMQVYQRKLRLVLYPPNGSPSFVDVRGTTQLTGDIWYNLIWAYGGNGLASDVAFYINGVQDTIATATGTVTTSIVPAQNLALGKTDGDPYLHAKFDEMALWTKKISPSEASAIYHGGQPIALNGMSNLAHWYRFETSLSPADSSSTIHDRVGAVDGTPVNISSGDFSTDVPNNASYYNIIFVANGTSSNIDYGAPASLQPTATTPFSYDYWLYLSAIAGPDQSFAGNNPSGGYGGWNFVVNGTATGFTGRMQVEFDGASPNEYFGVEGNAGDYTTGVWQNWGFSYDGSNSAAGIKVYRNGVLLATTTYGSVASLAGTLNAGFPLTIASQGNGSQWVNGRIFNPNYWSKELSAGTFLAMYNGGHPLNISTLPDYASFCVSNWQYNAIFNLGTFDLQAVDVKGSNTGTISNGGYLLSVP